MEPEASWIQKLQSSFSCKHPLPSVSCTTSMHTISEFGHIQMSSAQTPDYNLSPFQLRPDIHSTAAQAVQATSGIRPLDCHELSQLNVQEVPFYLKLHYSQPGYLLPPYESSRDVPLGCTDVSIPEENTEPSQMQSLRDYMTVDFPSSSVPSMPGGSELYQVPQDEDQVTLLEPRMASLPLFLNFADNSSGSYATATPHLRRSLGGRSELMNYRGLYSGELFGTERSPHRTQLQRESHILAERQRREEMNEKFTILRSMIPKLTKKDKASIVTDTISYIVELERNLKSLQACKVKSKSYVKLARKSPVQLENCNRSISTERGLHLCDENLRDAKGSEDSAMSTNSEQLRKDHFQEKRTCQVEVQKLGDQAVIKILSPRSRGIVLRLHIALDECKVDVIQSNVTTVGDNMIHFVTVELNPGVSATMDELVSALQLASSQS